MTALMSLKSRLAMSKLALYVRPEQADVKALAPFLLPSVDLLVLGSCGEAERDAEVLRDFREAYAHVTLLLATDNGDAAQVASADVVYLDRPAWRIFGEYPRGHEWTLLGRGARDVRTLRHPGDDFSFLFVPARADDLDSRTLQAALVDQKPLQQDTIVWFARGDFGVAEAKELVRAGVRRICLDGEVLDRDGDTASLLIGVKEALDRGWEDDPAGNDYRFFAVSL